MPQNWRTLCTCMLMGSSMYLSETSHMPAVQCLLAAAWQQPFTMLEEVGRPSVHAHRTRKQILKTQRARRQKDLPGDGKCVLHGPLALAACHAIPYHCKRNVSSCHDQSRNPQSVVGHMHDSGATHGWGGTRMCSQLRAAAPLFVHACSADFNCAMRTQSTQTYKHAGRQARTHARTQTRTEATRERVKDRKRHTE